MTKSLKKINSAKTQNLEKQELVHPDSLHDIPDIKKIDDNEKNIYLVWNN